MTCLLLLALAASPEPIPAYRFRPEAVPPGKRAAVVGPYEESLDGALRIEGCPTPFRLDDARAREALAFRPGKDTIRIEVERDGDGGLRVVSIARGPSAATIFARELERTDPSDAAALQALAARVRDRAGRTGDPALRELAQRIARKALAARGRSASSPSDRFRLLAEAVRTIGDAASIQALQAFADAHPDHEEARALLRRLGSVRYRGRWRTYAAYKEAEGYVRDGDAWIPRRELRFRGKIRELARTAGDPLQRRLTAEIYRSHARRGEVLPGMTPAETVLARGWPEAVHRRIVDGVTYAQWVYQGGYVYLRDGLVAATEGSAGGEGPAASHEARAQPPSWGRSASKGGEGPSAAGEAGG